MANYSDAQILVDTGAMLQKADSVEKSIRKMNESFRKMQEMVAATPSYWVGLAGDKHREMFKEKEEDITFMINRLMEHPQDLRKMAGGYEATETTAATENQQLRTDYI